MNKKFGLANGTASEPAEEPKAYFLRREQEIPLSRLVVEKVIELEQARYTPFVRHLYAEYDFIRENEAVMYRNAHRVWHCLLVKAQGERSGILVEAEGLPYARYTAYCSNCADVRENEAKSDAENCSVPRKLDEEEEQGWYAETSPRPPSHIPFLSIGPNKTRQQTSQLVECYAGLSAVTSTLLISYRYFVDSGETAFLLCLE